MRFVRLPWQGALMTEASFDRVISDHLALCARNKRLERWMPLDRYRDEVGGGSARVSRSTPPDEEPEQVTPGPEHWLDQESFWDASGERPFPEFDWGDD